ncbi:MAG: hypothetical protein HYX50_05855 [Chloroflexi bacterium]|nr:hypothetical protein [Chloroflexota bacterium]
MATLSGAHPRNSLAAVRECFDANVDRIEIDIHSLAGADYAVFHDRRLDPVTRGSGSIGAATPEDVRAATFRRPEGDRPALLSEVVELARACDTQMQLDWKDVRLLSRERLQTLIDVVAPVRERVMVSNGQDWNLRRLHAADPEFPFGFDPGHYLDHAVEGATIVLPRAMGAYGYRDDHPMALGRGEAVGDYLEERMTMLLAQAPGSREFFLSYRLVLQMLDDGFNPVTWLHERGLLANVWTADWAGAESAHRLRRLVEAGVDRITTNTAPAWMKAWAGQPVGSP